MSPVPCPAGHTRPQASPTLVLPRESRERVPAIWMSQPGRPRRSAPQAPLLNPPGPRFPAGHGGQDAPTSEVSLMSACTRLSVPSCTNPPGQGCTDSAGGREGMFELHVGLFSQVSNNFRNAAGLGSECKQGFSQNQ